MTPSTSRFRTPGRRVATALVATAALVASGPAVSAAQAQSTADQYGTAGATGTASNAITRVDFTTFGTLDERVRQDVRTALDRAALPFRALRTTDGRILRFLDGPIAPTLSKAGPDAVGRGVGEALTGSAPAAPGIFRALFPTDGPYRPVVASVVTRTEDVSKRQDRFSHGVAQGFATSVPTVYVERSDDKTSHVADFRDVPGVDVVDDIDTDAGKRRLVALLTGSSARTTAAPAADDGRIDAETSAAVGGTDDGTGIVGPAALLAVIGGVLFAVAGPGLRRRRRRTS
ncbi:hypothetical protein [Patulibacter sp.]|uniref:hypothetical protein n=1 Tax=Patulibacter sp. TaxID=1912859 RepID=UPI0027176DAB|nr:hypothetical protein [Patulibacter sp.]MDO9407865.1 hypothetical protein [Patulibacter sp.]